MKVDKNYILRVDATDGGTIEVKRPFSMSFDIKKDVLSSSNVASISIYNLGINTRNQIRKDQQDYGLLKAVTLNAGYGNNLSEILNANITQAYSMKQGVDIITTIDAFDGGFAYSNSRINKPYPGGTKQRSVVLDIVKSLDKYGVATGSIGQLGRKKGEPEKVTGRGNSYSGNSIEILRELTGGAFFIDNGVAHVLGPNEVLTGDIRSIDSENGLIGTPKREETLLLFDMIFEPMLRVGQKIELKSKTEKIFNGTYKIVSLHHRGMISEAVAGESVTTVGCFFGVENFTTISGEFL